MGYIFFIMAGYLSGSVMYAYLFPKWIKKIDIRTLSPDRNPGTANAFMYAGIPIGIIVIIFELLKGALPVYSASKLLNKEVPLFAFVMAAPVIGHAYISQGKRRKSDRRVFWRRDRALSGQYDAVPADFLFPPVFTGFYCQAAFTKGNADLYVLRDQQQPAASEPGAGGRNPDHCIYRYGQTLGSLSRRKIGAVSFPEKNKIINLRKVCLF